MVQPAACLSESTLGDAISRLCLASCAQLTVDECCLATALPSLSALPSPARLCTTALPVQVVCSPAKLVLTKTPGSCTHKYDAPLSWVGKVRPPSRGGGQLAAAPGGMFLAPAGPAWLLGRPQRSGVHQAGLSGAGSPAQPALAAARIHTVWPSPGSPAPLRCASSPAAWASMTVPSRAAGRRSSPLPTWSTYPSCAARCYVSHVGMASIHYCLNPDVGCFPIVILGTNLNTGAAHLHASLSMYSARLSAGSLVSQGQSQV